MGMKPRMKTTRTIMAGIDSDATPEAPKKMHKLQRVRGVYGHESMYINDYRVSGDKPWGGGTIMETWEISDQDLTLAMSQWRKNQ